MRKFQFRVFWILSWIILPAVSDLQGAESSVNKVELQRIGQQLNVLLYFDSLPIYQIHENLKRKTLLLKFMNAQLGFQKDQSEHLYNDPMLEGIRFTPEADDIWVQFKTRIPDLIYAVKNNQPHVLTVELRQKIDIEPLEPPPVPPALQLKDVRFSNHPPNFSRATFFFVRSQQPRMFFRQDKDQRVTTIRFSDTHPVPGLEIKQTKPDPRIRFDKMETDANQTFVTIQSTGKMDVKEMYQLDPPRWIIDFFGEAGAPLPEEQAVPEAEMTEEQKKADLKKRIESAKRRNAIKESYNLAEGALQQGENEQALELFLETYKLGKSQQSDVEDEPLDLLAIQSLFRRADALYEILQKANATNYHQAISAYETAIRVATANNSEIGDLLPHAYLQIGQSYRNMQFYDDANQTFDILQKKFPDTLEAAEANFWRAVGEVDRHEWKSAIDSFREYLRAGAREDHVAPAHYKMAEAYYNLREFSKAREGFDRARNIDVNYPERDPGLLFRMGETYYETADFATAREVFNLLLQKHPDADFSKLVALRLGDFLRDEGKEEEAIQVYEKAATSFKQDVAILGQLRKANIQAQRPYSEDYKEALKVYESIINLKSDSPLKEEAYLRKGLTLTLFGHYQEAIKALEEFTQKFPNNRYVRRGIIQENIDENLKGLVDQHFLEKDYLGVVGVYKDFKEKYLSKFRFDTTLFQVGISYQELGLFDDSIDVFKFLSNRGDSPLKELSHFQEAIALAEKGSVDEAREALIRFIRDFPESNYNADANKQLASVYKQGREYLEAIKVYEHTIRQYTQGTQNDPLRAEVVPELYYELGNLYQDLGRHAEAEQAYSQIPRHYFHPVVGEVGTDVPFYIALSYFLKSDMLFEMQRDTEALEKYQTAISMYENSEHPDILERIRWAQYKMGVIYQRTGREPKALEVFNKLLPSDPNLNLADASVLGALPLWQRLAVENHDLLKRQLEYQDYLKK
ncbi:MAG: tetratricopeptide repeat protein [SAR324 cluster bacterium]|nr:tetratricopeptide repeat protein [SAR324 cluster bacterium]